MPVRNPQVKIAVLESKTNSIEQNMILLASKLENLQFNFLATGKAPEKIQNETTKQEVEKCYLCDMCNYEHKDKSLLKEHKENTANACNKISNRLLDIPRNINKKNYF